MAPTGLRSRPWTVSLVWTIKQWTLRLDAVPARGKRGACVQPQVPLVHNMMNKLPQLPR